MRPQLLPLTIVLLLLLPHESHAWGHEAHRFIMDRAIALLPAEIGPFFEANRATVVERSIDPDTWRTVGFDEENKHHFLDIDWAGYGKPPFAELPRDYAAAVARFGIRRIEENGTLPWRVEEFHGNLRRAFESYGRQGGFARVEILLFAASLSHYISDALVPFHAVLNYDGQLTKQRGIHARFESILFERYRDRLTLTPRPVAPIRDPRDFSFDRIIEGAQLVPQVLKSDLEAIGARDVYDEAYYAALFAANRPVLERRLSESIAAVAAMITGAWEAAGRPPVPLNPPQPPQRRR